MQTQSQLNEELLRRPDFMEGEPIQLADGQEWHVPKPRVRVRPTFADGQFALDVKTTYGPEFDKLVEAVEQGTDAYRRILAMTRLAADLLRRNYDLQPEQVCGLLEFEFGEDSESVLHRIYSVACGFTPEKPMAGGSDVL